MSCAGANALASLPAPQTCITTADGRSRCWYTYMPSTTANVPLVIELHGLTVCAPYQSYTGMRQKALLEGFAIAWPMGVSRSWNGGRCCGDASNAPLTAQLGLDDVSFLRQVVSNILSANTNVDPDRVYFAGHSTGCIMAQRMAIDASDIVAAVGCHAGYIMKQNYPYWNNAAQTPPSGFVPRPVMEIQGRLDPTVTWAPSLFYWPGALRNLGWWGQLLGCPGYTAGSPAPTTTYTVSGEQYIRHQYTGCTGHEAVLIELPNARHMPFQGQDTAIDTAQIAWDFMRRFSRNGELLPPPPALPRPPPSPPPPYVAPPPPLPPTAATLSTTIVVSGSVPDFTAGVRTELTNKVAT